MIESIKEYAVITTDQERRITSWSGPAAAMFGYSPREILGQSISLLFTPEDIAAGVDESEFAKALENGRENDERWHMRKDGRRLYCYGLSFPLRGADGALRGFVKVIRDDSDRKSAEDRLRESEERLRLAAESTGLGAWEYDADSGVLRLSPRAAELFGLVPGRPEAGLAQFVERVVPEDRDRVRAALARCLETTTRRDADVEYRVRMPDGGVKWVRTLVRAFYDGGREEGRAPQRLLGTVVDITGAHERETRARDFSAELELRVKQRTAELDALNKELESFAYSASHDLRAPLRKIAAFSQAILQSGESRLADADRARFERIRSATAKMHALIDDTLLLSRVTRKPLEREHCDLSAMARRIAGDLRGEQPQREVDFRAEGGLHASCDRGLLEIALRNMLENAWKFTSRHARARVEFGAKTVNGRRAYFVKDDGAGFDMRFAKTLFGAFRRLHAESDFPGSGVGLAAVKRIVERHGGRIWAEAEVEKGATFFFTLEPERE
jgi:PAS domain S-box-containing protein